MDDPEETRNSCWTNERIRAATPVSDRVRRKLANERLRLFLPTWST
jgi:hypothetical protein